MLMFCLLSYQILFPLLEHIDAMTSSVTSTTPNTATKQNTPESPYGEWVMVRSQLEQVHQNI